MDDDSVAGVVAAGVAGDDVELFREDVDDLAFAFVAPLGSKDDGGLAALRARRKLAFGLIHEEGCSRVMLGRKCAQRCPGKDRSRP